MSGQGWEGIGGPIRIDQYSLDTDGLDQYSLDMDGIDPTLDSCCEREMESDRRAKALRQALQRHDIVAEKERRRRNLVTARSFDGCRCCYDPNSDGGEYRALIDLRAKLQQQQEALAEEVDEEEKKKEPCDVEEDSDDEFDYLLDEELPEENEELKMLEAQRRAELEMSMLEREVALQHGYGTHRQMHPCRVLKAAGVAPGTRDPPPAVVVHLVDPDSVASASLDLFLEKFAATTARGTKFLRSGGRSTMLIEAELAAKALPRLSREKDMPTLVAVRDGVVVNVCPRLRGLTDTSDMIVESAVEEWLSRCGVVLESPPRLNEVCRIRPEEEALTDYLMTQKPAEPEEERYDCGVAGCNKSFPHEHVGVQTKQQQGLVVPEETVVGKED